MKDALKKKIKNIKLVILDVDGVLTNGQINIDEDGRELKMYSVLDGFGIVMLHKMGYKTAVISARASKAVAARATDLGISEIHLKAFPKMDAYQKVLKKFKLKDEHVCFIGDDLPDLALLKRVGFAVAVKNAMPEIKRVSDYTTKKQGGYGAVREVLELILKTNGQWTQVIKAVS